MNKEVAYTVLVENVPRDERSSPALYRYFDYLFPGKVSVRDSMPHCLDASVSRCVPRAVPTVEVTAVKVTRALGLNGLETRWCHCAGDVTTWRFSPL